MERNIFSRVLFRYFLPIVPLIIVLCISDCYAVSPPLCPTSSLFHVITVTASVPLLPHCLAVSLGLCSSIALSLCLSTAPFSGPTFPLVPLSRVLTDLLYCSAAWLMAYCLPGILSCCSHGPTAPLLVLKLSSSYYSSLLLKDSFFRKKCIQSSYTELTVDNLLI